MTIIARKPLTAQVGVITLIAERHIGKTVMIHGPFGSQSAILSDPEGVDCMIELLHAIKSESIAPTRLAEDTPHLDIIAVDEPTA